MIGAIGYYFNQPKATLEAVKNYRSFYPTGTLVMINDGGVPETEEIATKFNGIYHPYPNNIGFGDNNDDINLTIEWLERFFKAIELIQEDYFIILEDDVKIYRPINTSKIDAEMIGHNPNNYLPVKATAYLKQFNNKIPSNCERIYYGGAGGSICKTDYFKQILKEDWKQELITYAELTKRNHKNEQSWYFNDCGLTFLCWRYGGALKQNPEFDEFHDHNRTIHRKIKENQITIAHKYKEFYNKPYDG